MTAGSWFLPAGILIPGSKASRVLQALYWLWAYCNIYLLLLGGALEEGLCHRGRAFYPYTYHGGQGLHLDWTMVREYDCIELYLYVIGPLVLYQATKLILGRKPEAIAGQDRHGNLTGASR